MKAKYRLSILRTFTLLILFAGITACGGNNLEVGQRYTLSGNGTLQITPSTGGSALKLETLPEMFSITGTAEIEIKDNPEDFVEVEIVQMKLTGSSETIGEVEVSLDPDETPADNTGEISKRDQEGNPFFTSFLDFHPGLSSSGGVSCGGTFIIVTAKEDPDRLTIDQGIALDCAGNEILVVQDLELTLPTDLINRLEESQ